jgi:hypothetical protein
MYSDWFKKEQFEFFDIELNDWLTCTGQGNNFVKPVNKPGVYCLFASLKFKPIEILYIGSTTALRNRLICHEKRTFIRKEYHTNPHIYFKYCDNFYNEEIRLIQSYNPLLNQIRYGQYIMDKN